MQTIKPRWEWRTFGQRFGEAEQRLAALAPQGQQESDEVYLLSSGGGNVKVRAALMDIKVLKQVNADGLEQWIPVMKAEFPLGPSRRQVADAGELCRAPRSAKGRARGPSSLTPG